MKKILFSSVIVVLFLSQTVLASFSDVTQQTYYKNAIDWMADNGVINGYGDGTFGPNKCVKRVEFLKMLFETLELDEKGYGNNLLFPDTYANEWYADYVKAARFLGVIDGYPDGTFKPAQCVNRAEAMKMAILQFNNGEVPGYDAMFGNPYDIASWEGVENEWWYEYYHYVFSANLVGTAHFEKFNADWSGLGVDSDFANPTFNFAPNGSMTRKEVAEMLYRMKAVKDNEEAIDGYYYEGLEPNLISGSLQGGSTDEIAFDGCGTLDKYENKSWFDDLEARYAEGDYMEDSVGAPYGEGCLSLDETLFIFIPSDFAQAHGCGKISKYDIANSALAEAPGNYCAAEFGSRIGNYVQFSGFQNDGGSPCQQYDGKYYFKENTIDFSTSAC